MSASRPGLFSDLAQKLFGICLSNKKPDKIISEVLTPIEIEDILDELDERFMTVIPNRRIFYETTIEEVDDLAKQVFGSDDSIPTKRSVDAEQSDRGSERTATQTNPQNSSKKSTSNSRVEALSIGYSKLTAIFHVFASALLITIIFFGSELEFFHIFLILVFVFTAGMGIKNLISRESVITVDDFGVKIGETFVRWENIAAFGYEQVIGVGQKAILIIHLRGNEKPWKLDIDRLKMTPAKIAEALDHRLHQARGGN